MAGRDRLAILEVQSYVRRDFQGLAVAGSWCESPTGEDLQGLGVKIVAAGTVDPRIMNSTVGTDRAVQHHVDILSARCPV